MVHGHVTYKTPRHKKWIKISKYLSLHIMHGKTVEQAFTLDAKIRLFFLAFFNIRMKLLTNHLVKVNNI